MRKGKGWFLESKRHRLSALGIRTGRKILPKKPISVLGGDQKMFYPKEADSITPLNLKSNRLPIQVSVIVPSTEFDKAIPKKEFRKRILKEKQFMNEIFGGDTTIRATGSVLIEKKGKKTKVVEEGSAIVESSMSAKSYKKNKKELEKHYKERLKNWKQDTILFKVEGESFIFPKKAFIDHQPSRKDILIS